MASIAVPPLGRGRGSDGFGGQGWIYSVLSSAFKWREMNGVDYHVRLPLGSSHTNLTLVQPRTRHSRTI